MIARLEDWSRIELIAVLITLGPDGERRNPDSNTTELEHTSNKHKCKYIFRHDHAFECFLFSLNKMLMCVYVWFGLGHERHAQV